MTRSSLPCFRENSMKNLEHRFLLNKNDYEASKAMKEIIYHAYENLNTIIYDEIQYY